MKTVLIYHEAVLKLVFMKILFIIKIIVNCQTFHYLLILLFIVKIIVYRQMIFVVKILSCIIKIIVHHGNYSY